MSTTSHSNIVYFSQSQTLKKIIEYSLEGISAELQEGSPNIPTQFDNCSLLIFDANLLNSSLAQKWESFLANVQCPIILLDNAMEPKHPLLQTSTSRKMILRKPFERENFLLSIQKLGLPFSFSKQGAKALEEPFDGAQMLPFSFQEQLRKEALAFVSDYCKSHFRTIAEDVLLKEIRRLTEERNSFLDEA